MTGPFLNQTERDSALWKKLQAHFEARLATLRARNDAELDPVKTARLRGRIAELKTTLLLAQDGPTKPSAED